MGAYNPLRQGLNYESISDLAARAFFAAPLLLLNNT